nr:unnamed protein product [Callosobruchus analis]CAI5825796.1 unnamed protein product [Callosobruchus analis]
MLKSRPCKIVEMPISKSGKHGHAEVYLMGIKMFSGRYYVRLYAYGSATRKT